MSDIEQTASTTGHGWTKKATYPLTAAMADDKATNTKRVENVTNSHGVRQNSEDGVISSHETVTGDSPPDNHFRDGKGGKFKKAAGNDISNTNAKLANPLGDMTDDEVMNNAAKFAEEHDLPVEIFRKGGLLAKRPQRFEMMKQLTEEDKEVLRHEISHKYDQPFVLYNLVVACSIAAAVQGMDESVISGAQLSYPTQFGINSQITGDPQDVWFVGLVNGAPYLCCAVFGCWLTDPLNRWLGRKGTIMLAAGISFATCIWSAVTNTWWHLFIARFFLGVGIGPKSATVPVFSAECVPAAIRGSLVMQWQMWTAFGIMLGYVADLAFFQIPDSSGIQGLHWRLMLGSAGLPALVCMAQLPFLPESPRWLLSKKRYKDAWESILRLRGKDLLAARDLYYMFVLLEEEAAIERGRSRFVEMFTIGRNRRAVYGASLVMFAQQFCGVNAIVYYTATIFTESGFSDIQALLASWGFGMTNFLFAIPALFTIDRFGRRPLLLFTFPCMCIMLLFTGFMFWVPNEQVRIALVAVGIYIYTMFYSTGEGPVPFTYSAEVFPLYIRELGMSWATVICWGFNFIVSLTFPALLQAFKPQGAFAWYAAWCAIIFVLVLFIMPETKGFQLEELDQVFSVPTPVHARYQLYATKWWIKKHFFGSKEEKKPLYHLDDDDSNDEKGSPQHNENGGRFSE